MWDSMAFYGCWECLGLVGLVFSWHPTHGAWVAGFVAELALPMYWSAQFAGDSRCLWGGARCLPLLKDFSWTSTGAMVKIHSMPEICFHHRPLCHTFPPWCRFVWFSSYKWKSIHSPRESPKYCTSAYVGLVFLSEAVSGWKWSRANSNKIATVIHNKHVP